MCNSCINPKVATAVLLQLKRAVDVNVCFRKWERGCIPLFVHSVFSHLNTDPQLPNDKLQAFSSARLVFGIIVHWKCRSETAVVPSALQVGAPCGPSGVLKERMCYKSADLSDCALLHHLSQTMVPSWLGWRGFSLLEGWGWGKLGNAGISTTFILELPESC